MEQDIKKVLISQEEIQKKIAEVGAQISADYAGKKLLMVGILKGSVVFMSDLMRSVSVHAKIDFMSVSSYGSGVKSSGVVKIIKDLDEALEGYDLLLVEDILDSGLTLSYLRELLRDRHPSSIRIVTLLNKSARRVADIQPDYCCFEVPDEFVVGYGLDYAEQYRNLPYVGVLKEEVYQA
ncbi:MAG: hypoxanthine phosphoribosyltransferase [Clostridiales bacterium]|nr:hypoxanthine phosphoribosyltransferase [Clostridiales bacterium]